MAQRSGYVTAAEATLKTGTFNHIGNSLTLELSKPIEIFNLSGLIRSFSEGQKMISQAIDGIKITGEIVNRETHKSANLLSVMGCVDISTTLQAKTNIELLVVLETDPNKPLHQKIFSDREINLKVTEVLRLFNEWLGQCITSNNCYNKTILDNQEIKTLLDSIRI